MSNLTGILSAPIDWHSAATNTNLRIFLQDLQANILKGHGRFHTGHIFISFAGMKPDAIAAMVRTVGAHCTSAYQQLRTNKKYPPHLDAGVVRCFFLSASGYRALGPLAKPPAGDAFDKGMGERHSVLADPPRSQWAEVGWRHGKPDAMILVADANPDAVTKDLEATEKWLNGTGAKILFVERGFQQSRQFRVGEKAEGVEHFGYVDGRSQPLVLKDEAAAEPHQHWKSAFPPSQFIVADPNGLTDVSAGSYFVFRKLEQDVRGFNAAETALGKALYGNAATDEQLDRAGAMVVGRFEDGTPLTLSRKELGQAVPNDFTYDADANGGKCPFHAHIRKTNPRGDIKREAHLLNDDADRAPIMIRRGITYGAPRPMTPDKKDFADEGHEPQHHSGLLFMAYMASVENQFEFVQQSWADNPAFAGNIGSASRFPTGIDPVIGQTQVVSQEEHEYSDLTDGMGPTVLKFGKFVHMQGGEYFFAPSLSFLRGVGL
jgi:Dyp-type peroxidase family